MDGSRGAPVSLVPVITPLVGDNDILTAPAHK